MIQYNKGKNLLQLKVNNHLKIVFSLCYYQNVKSFLYTCLKTLRLKMEAKHPKIVIKHCAEGGYVSWIIDAAIYIKVSLLFMVYFGEIYK